MRQINYYYIDLRKEKGEYTPAVPIESLEQASGYNENKLDIYWTVNEFSGPGKRKKEELRKIWSFYCEVDGMNQEEILSKLKNNLFPSLIIKSFNGFHLYWYLIEAIECADDPVGKAEWFREFVSTRIRPLFDADPQACDACRLLRAPFFKYWKRQKDGTLADGSFVVDIVYDNEQTKYSLKQIEIAFPKFKELIKKENKRFPNIGSGDFWTKANLLPAKESLQVLSGTSAVSGESLTFKKEKDITRIYVNSKPSNAWIDRNGKIGSTAGAAPAIPNWLHFYHRDWKRVAEILKEFFPELKETK